MVSSSHKTCQNRIEPKLHLSPSGKISGKVFGIILKIKTIISRVVGQDRSRHNAALHLHM